MSGLRIDVKLFISQSLKKVNEKRVNFKESERMGEYQSQDDEKSLYFRI